ncbi:PilN domain-containing protein [Malonomonas rubra]|uniref:PilN domain-containing protein n=1 Tax=Malonomonas rubra TaxID=57040 RepID=UPI0026ECBF3B|nr:PilN domain-containing protein [Malonomonas rubra]
MRDTSHLSDVQQKIEELNSQRAELRGQDGEQVGAETLDLRWAEVAFINQLLERDSFRWTDLLSKLEKQAFSGVAVKSIKPDFKDNSLELSGYARELSHLRKFIDNLISSEEFSEVYLLKQSQQKIKDRDGRERKAIAFELLLVQGT